MIIETVLGGLLGQLGALGNGWLKYKATKQNNDHLYKMADLENNQMIELAKHKALEVRAEHEHAVDVANINAFQSAIQSDANIGLEPWPPQPEFDGDRAAWFVSMIMWCVQVFVSVLRRIIRPAATLFYIAISADIATKLGVLEVAKLSAELQHVLTMRILDEIFFLTSLTLGFYFGNRPRRDRD